VVTGFDSCVQLEATTCELNAAGGLVAEAGGQMFLEKANVLRNGGPGVVARGRGTRLLMLSSCVQANEGDGVRVSFDTAAGSKTRDVTSFNALGAARNDAMMQMKGWTPVPHARQLAGHGGGGGGAGGVSVEISDGEIARNRGVGVRVEQVMAGCKLRRCRIEHNGSDGVRAENGGEAKVFDSRIEGNGLSGARAHGRAARCLLASTSLVSNAVGASAEGAELRMFMCKMAGNRKGEVERSNGGVVVEEKTVEGEGQWVEDVGGMPPRFHAELPWLAKLRDKLKTNTLRTWRGF